MTAEEKLWKEYESLSTLEQDTTRMRHPVYTAFLASSFVVAGLSLQSPATTPVFWGTSLGQLVFFLGFMLYCVGVLHYVWYHRYSHIYRARLKELESALGISVYRLRRRPRLGVLKFHFDWSLYILGALYGTCTAIVTGPALFFSGVGIVVAGYCLLLLSSAFNAEEPLEVKPAEANVGAN